MHPIKHRFRTGLIVGVGVGYVLGTRAGRERYEQLVRAWQRMSQSPPARRIEEAAGNAFQQLEHKVQDAVTRRRSGNGMEAGFGGPDTTP